jgi:hypothetical protein
VTEIGWHPSASQLRHEGIRKARAAREESSLNHGEKICFEKVGETIKIHAEHIRWFLSIYVPPLATTRHDQEVGQLSLRSLASLLVILKTRETMAGNYPEFGTFNKRIVKKWTSFKGL